MYTTQEIENFIIDWTSKNLGSKFEFREHQLEAIVNIIENILDHHYHNYVIEAPTGSGKSLINIISGGVLSDVFNISSYILCSDLFLWDQYDQFLKKYPHLDIGIIKGQTGNYTCNLNKEDIKNADCQMCGLSWSSLYSPAIRKKYGYECAKTCEYVKARQKATKCKCVVMTYHLFTYYMNNSMYDNEGNPIFAPHDVIFCDEAHNIPDIIQLAYSPTITRSDLERIEFVYNEFMKDKMDLFNDFDFEKLNISINNVQYNLIKTYPNYEALHKELEDIFGIWIIPETRKDEDSIKLHTYLHILQMLNPLCNIIKSQISEKKINGETITKDDIKMFKELSWLEAHTCHWYDFISAIELAGEEYLLKTVTIKNKNEDPIVSFKCTKEDVIVWYFFLRKAKFKVMLSATIGGKEAFDERMGFCHEEAIQDYDYPNAVYNESYMTIIPSTFDFTESPVYFLNKFKMSYNEREISFKHLKTAIYSICKTKFKGQKGMIQTGSYEFAKRLYDDAPYDIKERMLMYNGSREKISTINLHKWSEDTILVGPTLNTGIDLPGDDCRFIIILKVPYPTLMDKLVNERNKLYPLWYNSHTSNEIIQGIGRGVRYNGDWCVTYILDACFNQLYVSTKDQYPKELQERIKTI